jgi:hypothetical protein
MASHASNCPTSSPAFVLDNTKSGVQALDQGAIACFKALICRKLVCLLTKLVDEPANKDK